MEAATRPARLHSDLAAAAGPRLGSAKEPHGNTAIVGGPYDNSDAGAAWAYGRSGTVWSQQHKKLVGLGATDALSRAFPLHSPSTAAPPSRVGSLTTRP